jgi:FixJ family two-component response regulator
MKNSRVIIVDDDSDLRESLNAWLSQDYLVEAFDSAESFLLAIKDFRFEDGIATCIALDFKMPGMNGVELQRTLKEINVEFPIIFMSGNALQADVIDAWQEGAVNFILKPFAASKISDAIQRLFTTVNQHDKDKRDAPDKTSNIELPINQREEALSMASSYSESPHGIGIKNMNAKESFNTSTGSSFKNSSRGIPNSLFQ